jgi:protein-tyrosine phosphatase
MSSVLFVCLGNICRSPSAEAVFRALVEENNMGDTITIDSAGTAGWHTGNPPDDRAQLVGREHGFDLSDQRARRVTLQDFDDFEYLIAMDQSNLQHLQRMAPKNFKGSIALMLDFAGTKGEEVPDPYYGGIADYHLVFDLLKPAALGLLNHIRQHHVL